MSPEGRRHDAHSASWRRLLPGQRSRLMVFDLTAGSSSCVSETTDVVIEAPNWTPDGAWLYFNSERAADVLGHSQLSACGRMEAVSNS